MFDFLFWWSLGWWSCAWMCRITKTTDDVQFMFLTVGTVMWPLMLLAIGLGELLDWWFGTDEVTT